MMEDAGRGWRHCVPSPEPRAVVNLRMIEALLDTGAVVIAGGGGGIPVVRDAKGDLQGVEAVVDKDLTSALLATALGLKTLLILTAVERVAVDFGTPQQRNLETVTLAELKAFQRAGHFAKGSMGPKVDAAIRHIEAGGERAIIAHLEQRARRARRRERHPCRSRLASPAASRATRSRSAKAKCAPCSSAASTCASRRALCLRRRRLARPRAAQCAGRWLPAGGDRREGFRFRRRSAWQPPPRCAMRSSSQLERRASPTKAWAACSSGSTTRSRRTRSRRSKRSTHGCATASRCRPRRRR